MVTNRLPLMTQWLSRPRKYHFVILVLLVLVLFPAVRFTGSAHIQWIITHSAIMAMLSLALHIMYGYAGLFCFGMTGFYATGAYSFTVAVRELGLHYSLALPFSLVVSAAVALFFGVALMRLRHWVLGLGTLFFGSVIFLFTKTVATPVLGGDDGLNVPRLMLFGEPAGSQFYYYAILAALTAVFVITHFIGQSRFGRALKAVRDDEVAARSMGINVDFYIRVGFMLMGIFAGLAGACYSMWNGWISPGSFDTHINLMCMVFVAVGGTGFTSGAVIGAFLFTALPDMLAGLREYHVFLSALILFLTIRFMPAGIVGSIRLFWLSRRFGPPDSEKLDASIGSAVPATKRRYQQLMSSLRKAIGRTSP